MTYFANAPSPDELGDEQSTLLRNCTAMLERLSLDRVGRTFVEAEDGGFGLIIERSDEAVRLLVGIGPEFTTVGVDVKGTPILLPHVAPSEVVGLLEGLLTGSMRLAVLMVKTNAVRVDVVGTDGRTMGKYGLMSRWMRPLLFWKRRIVFDVNFLPTGS